MSQRAALRGFILCSLALLVALPGAAQIALPSVVNLSVGETSAPITAQVTFSATGPLAGGLQTLVFGAGNGLPYGISTVPSPVTFTTAPGQTTATVVFSLVAAPWATPGLGAIPVTCSPEFAYGLLYYDVFPVSVQPEVISVDAGQTTGPITATVSVGFAPTQGTPQLVFSGLPDGASPAPDPVTLAPGPQQNWAIATFSIATSAFTPPGSYVVGVGYDYPVGAALREPGGPAPLAVVSDTIVLEVRSAGGLAVTPSATVVAGCPGGAPVAVSALVEAVDDYSGTPTVTFPSLPSGLVVTPSSILLDVVPPSRTASFEISVEPGTPPGPRVVNVLASDPYGSYATASIVVQVGSGDFDPKVSPSILALFSGGAGAALTVGLAPGACAPPDRIVVTPTGLPSGVTATPASAVLVAPDFSPVVFSLAAASSVLSGVYEAGVRFETPTGEPRTAPLALMVSRLGSIDVRLDRAKVDVCPGGPGAPNSLTVGTVAGYSGTPTVTFPDLPAGLTVTPEVIAVPSLPPAQVVSFAVKAAPGTAAGPRTVTVVVSDPRGPSTTVSFVADVLAGDFTPAVAPGSVALDGGGAPGSIAASLVPGACPPSSGVRVTPSGLPAGVTVAPASALIAGPGFAPVAFSFQASSSAAPGTTTITFAFDPGAGGAPRVATAQLTVCGPPAAPAAPAVKPKGNPTGPVTATDFLDLSWAAPASGFVPTRYEWRINGGAWNAATSTSASAPPRGAVDPVQLFVRGFSCAPERGPGAEAASPIYPLAPPTANFSFPTPVVAGRPVTFTDTSSPQATSWLWFPGDGMAATTVQSPTVTFPVAGPKVVVLVATNGSGSSTKSVTVSVQAATSAKEPPAAAFRALQREPDGRLALGGVEVEQGTAIRLRRLTGEGEAVAFLRFLDADGNVVVERRLVVAEGEEARHDLSAWGPSGAFRVEVVGPEGLEAVVEERAIPFGGPEEPVRPVRPPSALR